MDWIIGFYNYRVVATYFPAFMEGLGVTLLVSAWSLVIALTIGTIVALMNISKRRWLNLAASAYIQAIRSTPLLIQVYLVYFAVGVIPLLDRRLTELEGGIIALALNAGAFMSEIIRAGIESISRGQVEGAQSVGMTYLQRMRHVILPQAIARVIPPLIGQTAVMIKDSSLVSFIGVTELTAAGLILMSERLLPNEGFLTSAALYLVIYVIMLHVSNYAQRRLSGA
ncbi:MAG: amino acid ABC transporter permease [Gammaproteobacteria bacterium]|nr:amino acid ABC transporter permease [Gammaproteobacteria bacterium]